MSSWRTFEAEPRYWIHSARLSLTDTQLRAEPLLCALVVEDELLQNAMNAWLDAQPFRWRRDARAQWVDDGRELFDRRAHLRDLFLDCLKSNQQATHPSQ